MTSLLLVGDAVVGFIAIFSGLILREEQRLGFDALRASLRTIGPQLALWASVSDAVFLWMMILFRTYERTNLYRVFRSYKSIMKAALGWATATWAFLGFVRAGEFSPRIGVVYCVANLFVLLSLWRTAIFAWMLHPRMRERVSSRVIVVGWNNRAESLRRAMRLDLGQLSEIIGCVPLPGGYFAKNPPKELAVLGDYSALPRLVRECQADSIILAGVSCPPAEIHHLISFCQRELLGFKMIPEYFPALHSGLQVQTLSGVPLLGVTELPLDRAMNRVVKRGIDIIGGLIGLALSAPIVPVFCFLVYLESPGPVIFKQRRTSRSGRDFYIYKIRSMRLNAESGTGAVWCKKEDARRLKIGSFMRRTNIDELPQFINVLKGDMSLVGPRPERPELIEKFKDEIPNYNARHEVRAGLTGWAQINGLRGDTDLSKRIEADLYYLENWSPLLDVFCLFATFFKVKNAY